MKVKNYYAILGIMPSAEDVVVQGAYRALADVWTGDRAFAESKMKELNEAYAVLSDKKKRERYDNVRKNNGFKDAHLKSEETEAPPKGVLKAAAPRPPAKECALDRRGPRQHSGHWGSVQRTLALLAALLVVAGALVWLRPQLRDVTEMSPALRPKISNRIEPPTSPVSQDGQRVAISPQLPRPSSSADTVAPVAQPAPKPKIPDCVGQPSSNDQPVAPVAQKVVLYDEDPSGPKGRQFVGSVVLADRADQGLG